MCVNYNMLAVTVCNSYFGSGYSVFDLVQLTQNYTELNRTKIWFDSTVWLMEILLKILVSVGLNSIKFF